MNSFIFRSHRLYALQFFGAFAVLFVAASCGYFFNESLFALPALVWPPAGIAMALLWLRGYRLLVPILLGLIVASVVSETGTLSPATIIVPLSEVSMYIAGIYLLKHFQFNDTFATMRDVGLFFIAVIASSIITPTIHLLVSHTVPFLPEDAYTSWSRMWAGYVFSTVVLFPAIISWLKFSHRPTSRTWFEVIGIFSLLVVALSLFHAIQLRSEYVFSALALFFFAHFWICLRFSIQSVAVSLLLISVGGLMALVAAPDLGISFSQQTFLFQLFMLLIVPMSYAFAVLVKERDNTIKDLQGAMYRINNENLVKNDFIAVLAHELRNPLSPVKTTLEVLELETHEPESKRMIQNAHRQIHAMRRLLDDLLDIARVTQGKFKLRRETANLCELIESAISSTKTVFQERQHTLIHPIPCDESIWVDVDPVRIEQVLVNILNNAAKYTDVGGRVVIAYAVRENEVEIKISDNGQGIDVRHLENVFMRFWQMKTRATPDIGGGIGVGLSLTKHIIEMHGGTITAESEGVGKGSVFTIVLPHDAGLTPTPVHHSNTTFDTTQSSHSLSVLVVDDNMAAADSLAKLLRLKNYSVIVAYTGEDAAQKVVVHDPDILLLDIGLPDINGLELAQRIRSTGFNKHIITLSGYGQAEDIKKAIASGCNAHFIKPMAMSTFETYIEAHTEEITHQKTT